MLHITNGDCAVAVLAQAVQGEFLPWRDVLHEGPVRAGLPLEALSRERAAFIAAAGWAPLPQVAESFAARDRQLRLSSAHEEVVLWFEHDLYDQLQLLQLLDWFARQPHARLSLVCEAEYLGLMTPARAAALFAARRPVSEAQLAAGCAAWAAFTSGDPFDIRTGPTAALPYLGAALRRLLEEYPWTGDGLSRLERQILQALRGAPLSFDALFAQVQRAEAAQFLGDTVLRWHLARLAEDGLLGDAAPYALTDGARAVLEGRADAWARPRRARWLGGYEIRDARVRWAPSAAVLCRT